MGVGMRDTTRHINHNRAPLSAPHSAKHAFVHPAMTRAARVDLLRRLVGAGQYQVSPRALATRILLVAGIPALDE
jgi:anti-sigma28 factor (negative regulator of flagellin synthesis)